MKVKVAVTFPGMSMHGTDVPDQLVRGRRLDGSRGIHLQRSTDAGVEGYQI